ncbi:diguanylate cyclase [Denitromonas iodatirespirans]|uniref:Sensor protein FixL n=1 Tax=Denitromonas iodatirespirans TaxID=2795389 RepID=A0A944H7V4_DENI1|nr:diguanylate cyclase [Denitromonas iodatirespirans]MBT0960700.1 diguanylate cyclase [Denitromonas iodatirespirans]
MIESQWVRQPVLAMVYALTGALASLFPGPVAGELTIALPAAVALLGALACGTWALVGITAGALCFGLVADPLLMSGEGALAFRPALVMAGAANLQAFTGAFLIRRFVPGWWQLTQVRDIFRLLLFGAAIAAVPWAAIRLGVHLVIDARPPATPFEVFAAAWLSQVVAVAGLFTLLMPLLRWRDPLWRARWTTLVLPAGAMLLAVLALSRLAVDVETQRRSAYFTALGSAVSHRFQDRIDAAMAAMAVADRFLEASPSSRRGFHHQLGSLMPGIPGLAAILWVPRMAADQREAFEQLARDDGLVGFELVEFDAQERLVPAQAREQYFPVFFAVSGQAMPFRLGTDMASQTVWKAAINRAVTRNAVAVSSVYRIPDESEADAAVLLVSPVQPLAGSGDGPRGLAVGVLQLAPLMASVRAEFDQSGLFLSLVDTTATVGQTLYRTAGAPDAPGMTRVETIPVGDRLWQLHLVSDERFAVADGVPLLWIAMVGSGVLFVLMQGFLLTASGQRVEVARQIAEGTARLTEEVEERRRVEATLRQSEARMGGVFRAVLDGIVIIDEAGIIDSVNPAAAGIFGWTAEELVGRNVSMLMPEPFGRQHDIFLSDYPLTGHKRTIGFHRTVEGLRKHGSRFPVELTLSELVLADRTLFVGVVRDVSDRVAAAEQARLFNEQLQDMVGALERRDTELTELNRTNEQLMACNDRAEAAEVLSLAMARMFPGTSGRIAAHVPGQRDGHLLTWVRWGDNAGLREWFSPEDCWAVRQGRSYEVVATEALVRCNHMTPAAGAYICLPLQVQGQVQAVLTLAYGASAELQRNSQRRMIHAVAESINLALSNLNLRETLRDQVVRDPLTQLYNRRYMEMTLASEVKRAQRNGSQLGCAVIDLDHFKEINDAYGHDVGDEVLRRIADSLGGWFRSSDTVCRFGGEEFVVILPEQTADAIVERLEDLQTHFADEVFHAGNRRFGRCTFSAGIAVMSGEEIDAAVLLKQADNALYAAKAAGRNRVVLAGD